MELHDLGECRRSSGTFFVEGGDINGLFWKDRWERENTVIIRAFAMSSTKEHS